MITRRHFLGSAAASASLLAVSPFPTSSTATAAQTNTPRKKMAVITTSWRYRSHAWHMAERFLVGYPVQGRWHQPPFEVVSA